MSEPSLQERYRALASQPVQDTWPDSQAFCKFMDGSPGRYVTPRFGPDDGPVGLYSLVSQQSNSHMRSLLQDCRRVFDQFCQEVLPQMFGLDYDKDIAPNLVHSKALHMSVTIFQENPRLLVNQPEDLADWKPMTTKQLQQLAEQLFPRSDNSTNVPPLNFQTQRWDDVDPSFPVVPTSTLAPRLELDSMIWTPDGALIVGFVEDPSALSSLQALRRDFVQTGQAVLDGKVNSRPKNLIHCTVGRVLGLPPVCYQNKTAVSSLIQDWNTRILPAKVRRLKQEHPEGGRFFLKHVSLRRERVWFCEEGQNLITWQMQEDMVKKEA